MIFFTPCGEPFTQRTAERLAGEERLLLVCGRYEGIDERVYARADERISLGDYVLTGGELAAMVVADAVVRLLPGALGDEMSAQGRVILGGGSSGVRAVHPPGVVPRPGRAADPAFGRPRQDRRLAPRQCA